MNFIPCCCNCNTDPFCVATCTDEDPYEIVCYRGSSCYYGTGNCCPCVTFPADGFPVINKCISINCGDSGFIATAYFTGESSTTYWGVPNTRTAIPFPEDSAPCPPPFAKCCPVTEFLYLGTYTYEWSYSLLVRPVVTSVIHKYDVCIYETEVQCEEDEEPVTKWVVYSKLTKKMRVGYNISTSSTYSRSGDDAPSPCWETIKLAQFPCSYEENLPFGICDNTPESKGYWWNNYWHEEIFAFERVKIFDEKPEGDIVFNIDDKIPEGCVITNENNCKLPVEYVDEININIPPFCLPCPCKEGFFVPPLEEVTYTVNTYCQSFEIPGCPSLLTPPCEDWDIDNCYGIPKICLGFNGYVCAEKTIKKYPDFIGANPGWYVALCQVNCNPPENPDPYAGDDCDGSVLGQYRIINQGPNPPIGCNWAEGGIDPDPWKGCWGRVVFVSGTNQCADEYEGCCLETCPENGCPVTVSQCNPECIVDCNNYICEWLWNDCRSPTYWGAIPDEHGVTFTTECATIPVVATFPFEPWCVRITWPENV